MGARRHLQCFSRPAFDNRDRPLFLMKCVLDIFFLLPFSPLEGQVLRKQRGGIHDRLYPVIHGKEFGDRGPRLRRGDQFRQRPVSVRTSPLTAITAVPAVIFSQEIS